jgi:hypothetical protein
MITMPVQQKRLLAVILQGVVEFILKRLIA